MDGTDLDALVVQLQAEVDSLPKNLSRLGRLEQVDLLLADEPALLVVDPDTRADDAVPNGLGDDVLCVLLVVELQLDADVPERNLGIRLRDLGEARLDDVMSETKNERVGAFGVEGRAVHRERGLESREVTNSNSWKSEMRCQCLPRGINEV